MGEVLVKEESSQSRTGKHKWRSLYFVLDRNCKPLKYEVVSEERVKGVYCKGAAVLRKLKVPGNAYVIKLDFCLNLRKMLKGRIVIIDSNGDVLGEAVYRKLKVRFKYLISDDIVELVRCVFHKLKLPVKKYAVIKH